MLPNSAVAFDVRSTREPSSTVHLDQLALFSMNAPGKLRELLCLDVTTAATRLTSSPVPQPGMDP